MDLWKKKKELAGRVLSTCLVSSIVVVISLISVVSAAGDSKGSIMLDTASYIMAPGNQYTIGAFIKDPSGKQLTASEIKALVSQNKLKVRDSRTGSIVNLDQLPSGHFRVTGKKAGTCYIVYEIGGTHASIRIDVQNGVKQHGSAVRNTSLFTQDVFQSLISKERALKLAEEYSGYRNGQAEGNDYVIQFWNLEVQTYNGRRVYGFQIRRLRTIEGPQLTTLMETIYVDMETGRCHSEEPFSEPF